jgi:hypothetical protein
MPHGVWLAAAAALAAAAVALIVLLYLRERGLRPWQRAVLSGLRLLALALVLVILLNPRLLTEITLEHPGKTLLLFDVSASMAQRDPFERDEAAMVERAAGLDPSERPSRAEIGAAILERYDLDARLRAKNRLQVFTFGAKVAELGRIASADDVAPLAGETRLGDAILEAVKAAGRAPLAGLVVFSDGRSNSGESPLAAAREVAARYGAPLHAVGLGKAQLPKNYAVEDLTVPPVVEVDYPVEIEAKVTVSGLPGKVTASLFRSLRRGGRRELVEARELEARGQLLETRIHFVDKLPAKGIYRYTLSFPRDPEEVELRDNQRSADVTVAEEKRRVLLVGGQATPAFQFVRRHAFRDDGVQVSAWLASADPGYIQDGDVVIDSLPASADALREYDVVVLVDPDPATLSEGFQHALVDFVVEQNGGLAYAAGEINTPAVATGPAFRHLRSLIPVDLASARVVRNQVHSTPRRAALTARGRTHPLCRLEDDEDRNAERWKRLPAFHFVFPAEKLRPGGIDLARASDGVLIAVQRVGMTEVVYLGSDELWQWHPTASVDPHERFWSSLLRYLALGKLQSGTGKVTVETDRDQYRERDQVRLVAHLVDGRRQPVDQPRVDVIIERTGEGDAALGPASAAPSDASSAPGVAAGSTATGASASSPSRWTLGLSRDPASPGRYSGVWTAPVPGHYEARIDDRAQAFFRVSALANEWDDPTPDFELLEQLARESHGRLFTLDDVDELPGAIPERKAVEVLGRRAATIWDSSAMMCLFTAFLVVEWVLRKLWRLN